MREEGLEPSCREAPDPKSGVSAIPPPPHVSKVSERIYNVELPCNRRSEASKVAVRSPLRGWRNYVTVNYHNLFWVLDQALEYAWIGKATSKISMK